MGKTKTTTDEGSGKTRSIFGKLLSRTKDKKQAPSQEELNRQAEQTWLSDRTDVQRLKQRLTQAGAPVPALIATALADADPRLPRAAQVQAGQQAVAEALAAQDAVTAFIAARNTVQTGKDQAGLLRFGAHPMITKFAQTLDSTRDKVDEDWTGATTAQDAARHADRLGRFLKGALDTRSDVHTQLEGADKLISKAEQALAKVSGIGTIDVSELNGKVVKARTAFQQVASAKELPAIVQPLEGWETALSEAIKGKSKAVDKLSAYRKRRQSVLDDIGKALLLRGATEDTPLRQLLNAARIDIGLADEAMAKVGGDGLIDKANEILEQHKGLLDRAKKLDAELKQQAQADLAALSQYTAAYNELARARLQMAGMAGTDAQVREADIALAAARLGNDGKPAGGYAAALLALKGKAAALLKSATEVSGNFVKDRVKQFPGLAALKERADTVLLNYLNVHPPAQAGAQQEALAKAMAQNDPGAALQLLIGQWNRAIESQRETDELLFAERQRMTDLLQQLEGLNAPAPTLNALRSTEPVDRLREAREFAQGLALARRTTTAAADYLLVAADLNRRWTQAKSDMGSASSTAMRWADWPPLANEAKSIAADVLLILQAVAKGTDGLEGALLAAGRIQERVDALELRATALHLDPQVDLKAHKEAMVQANQAWALAAQPARQALQALALALGQQGAGDSAADTVWHRQFAALDKRWQDGLANPRLAPGQTPAQALADALQQFKAEVLLIQKGAAAAAGGDALEGLLASAQAQDQERQLRELHARLSQRVREIESLRAPTAAFWQVLGRDFDLVKAQDLADKWNKLDPILARTLQLKQQELASLQQGSIEKAGVLKGTLSNLISKNQVRFPGFFEDLRGRTTDAEAMLASGDPTLIAAGHQQIEQMASMLEQARRGGESEGGGTAKTFDDVADLWRQLSKQVGLEVLMKRLPATYNRLYSQLKSAVEKAKSLPPGEGWAVLDALRVPIDDAVAQAERVAERYALFKARREQLEDKLVALHKLTNTRFTEKTDAYNDKFATRMAMAKTLAKQEGQMDAAFALLDGLNQELSGLLAAPETARAELQKLDGEAAAEQRELRDLARHWEASRSYWDDTVLPRVKKAMASRGEESNTEYDDLKGAVSRAGAPLKAYLGVISKLPHEYLATNASPDMKQARSAFTAAQGRLHQLEKSANRLIVGGGSTNVELQTNLAKLEEEWVSRVQRVHTALGKLADAIRQVPDQASTNPAETATYLAPQLLGQLRTACNVVGRSVPEAGARFEESAFAVPMSVLRSTSASEPDRKKAREDMLRTMRRLRDEVVDSVLFRQLFDGAKSGALDVDVRNELGLLRASLKKIELAALVAV